MSLFALGVNHKTAPIKIREKLAFDPDKMDLALQGLVSAPDIQEAAILSTCNRTEVYFGANDENVENAILWLSDYHKLKEQELRPYLYSYPDSEAVRHMLRVASGLDSMILGEPQILGQLKDAYATATHAGTVGKLLGRLFQHTFSVAKQIRTDTAIGSSPVSIAFAAVNLAKQIFGNLNESTVLLIGAGETIELAARHLAETGIKKMIVANRTVERAKILADQFNGEAIPLALLPEYLADADIVISSTASQLPILGKGAVERAIKKRKHRPMFMVDIAVPRDIEPEVGDLRDIYLYGVDDMQEVIQENLKSRQEAAGQAEEIIDTQTAHFMGWLQSLGATSTIRTYRDKAKNIQNAELEKAKRKLSNGEDPNKVIQELAHALTNKLIHTPSARMLQAGYDGELDLLQSAIELLELNKDTD